ncbi:SDR family NAD(P)-dependent oxidoreductase [Halobacillus kuroshimensis]|uniref:SDR family NAD(P)-dependent oxidoreductase n=1 Tax=Halobacillus kuroshimensis TaxID=302481 RepID=UPI000416C6A6|nr:SDR family NAD(P)-dependent oxidoreductase [Halobacillus kuroshimensis]
MRRNTAVVVTEAAEGMGREAALQLAAEGASLAVTGYSEDIFLFKEVLEQKGAGRVLAFQADVTEENDMEHVVQAARNAFGRVDVLVTHAYFEDSGSLESVTVEEWQRTYERNVQGIFLPVKAVFPAMKQQRSGKIITAFQHPVQQKSVLNSSGLAAVEAFVHAVMEEAGPYQVQTSMVHVSIDTQSLDDVEWTKEWARAFTTVLDDPSPMAVQRIRSEDKHVK